MNHCFSDSSWDWR